MTKILIGADIGGSHITCMGVDPIGHVVSDVFKVRREVDCLASADEILSGWAGAIGKLIDIMGRDVLGGVGFAMPGPFDYPGGIAWFKGVQKYDSLYGVNVIDELRSRLGLDPSVPVRFLNDASCFAIGEAWTGRAAAFGKSIAITLGTGFGSAFIADGIPVESGPEVPQYGCVYHLPYGSGIADDNFSTRWFQKRYKELTGKEIEGVREMVEKDAGSGMQDVQDAESKMQDGNEDSSSRILHPASLIFSEFGTGLGTFLAPWLIKFRAGCLTIGGNISLAWPLFAKPFTEALKENGCYIPVFISEFGELAAISGAARLCNDDFYLKLPFISNK
ncbi:MAG: ROK family protein [Bacteroidota bacterium]